MNIFYNTYMDYTYTIYEFEFTFIMYIFNYIFTPQPTIVGDVSVYIYTSNDYYFYKIFPFF